MIQSERLFNLFIKFKFIAKKEKAETRRKSEIKGLTAREEDDERALKQPARGSVGPTVAAASGLTAVRLASGQLG